MRSGEGCTPPFGTVNPWDLVNGTYRCQLVGSGSLWKVGDTLREGVRPRGTPFVTSLVQNQFLWEEQINLNTSP